MARDDQAEAVKRARKRRDSNRMRIEPAPNSPGTVIDPRDPDAQRKFQRQQAVQRERQMVKSWPEGMKRT